MEFDATITDTKERILDLGLVDQDGQKFTELPSGATFDVVSSNEAAVAVVPLPGGILYRMTTPAPGEATITMTPGGTLTGPKFQPKEGKITVILGEPFAFAPTLGEEVDEPGPGPGDGGL